MKRVTRFSLLAVAGLLFFTLQSFKSSTCVGWVEVYDQAGMTVSFNMTDCGGHDVLLFRIINNTGQEEEVDFMIRIEDQVGSPNMMENIRFTQTVKDGDVFESSCNGSVNPFGDYIVLPQKYTAPNVSISMN